MTVALACAFYWCSDPVRAEITRRVFKHYASMPVTLIGVGSEGDLSREIFCEYHPEDQYREYVQGWDEYPASGHQGLRDKFNYAIEATRGYDPEAVYIIGSDDVVDESFFVPSTADLIGCSRGPDAGCYYWEPGSDEAWWWAGPPLRSSGFPFVHGCMGMSLRLLEEFQWRPFCRPGDEVGVWEAVKDNQWFTVEARAGIPSWHPKSRAVLNNLDNLRHHLDLYPAQPETVAQFRAYWESLA